jgi:exodeoxyribonuclease X
MTDIKNATFCVIDIETTGLNFQKDRICEIAFVVTTKDEVICTAETFVNPGIPIPALASSIHHIVDKDVTDAPFDFPYGITLPHRDCYVAHNAAFDSTFLPKLKPKPWLCTMRMAKRVLPKMEKYTNQFLRYHLGLEIELPGGALPHRALPDALVTAALLRHLLANLPEEVPSTMSEFTEWASTPLLLDMCDFGKHKGRPWASVPKDYLHWMMRERRDLDIDTHFTVQHYLSR